MASASEQPAIDPEYQYYPLQSPTSIRVLDTRIEIRNGDIVCRLTEINLDDPNRSAYTTLSYTWGNPLASFYEANAPLLQDLFGEHDVQDLFTEQDVPLHPHAFEEYDWMQQRRIFIEGPDGASAGFLSATKNLHDFLSELNRNPPSNAGWIWIDRICINQDDSAEVASQIMMMGRIYQNCDSVIAWLGVAGMETGLAFEVFRGMQGFTEGEWAQKMRYDHKRNIEGIDDPSMLPARVKEATEKPTAAHWDACIHFFQRAWFYRGWTLQESTLPPEGEFWCGPLRAPLENFHRPIHMLETFLSQNNRDSVILTNTAPSKWPEDVTRRLKFLRIARARFALDNNPLNEPPWNSIREGFCINPRDKVYSVLGIFAHPPVYPDYTRPVADVYRDFVVTVESSLDVILYMKENLSLKVTPNLPSWVPDFAARAQEPIPWTYLGARFAYRAGWSEADTSPLRLDHPDPNILAIHGIEADTVSHVAASYEELTQADGLLSSLGIMHLVSPTLAASRNGEDPVSTFWRTLTANLVGAGPERVRPELHGRGFRVLATHCLARSADSDPTTVRNLLEQVQSPFLPSWEEILEYTRGGNATKEKAAEEAVIFLDALRAMFNGRRIFFTEAGRIGIGPEGVEKGDRVVVLRGMRFPFVMRKVGQEEEEEGGNSRYSLVGHCFAEGIMEGEVLGGEWLRLEIE